MAPDAKATPDDRVFRMLLGALAAAGLAVSAYLAWAHLAGVEPVCVAGGAGCRTVQASRYAAVAGVPMPALGLAGYAGLLLAAGLRGGAGAYLGLLLALTGTLFSAYLTYLEVFVIGALCQWCVARPALMAPPRAGAALRVAVLPRGG